MPRQSHYHKVIASSKTIEEALSSRGGENPYKGECYVASSLLYDAYQGKDMQLRKGRDHEGRWHWWIEVWDGQEYKTLDMTRNQYLLEGHPCPSDQDGGVKAKPMSYPSYERRKKSLAEEITRSLIGTRMERRSTRETNAHQESRKGPTA